ncbi:hypothetical protein [Burkholderia ubonensis]|uniref:Uncharacterized protein n=1 Tax=Burkholderia ubonensis TaxID=101571 RepID=A0A1R1J895_9BURK|nr:hypothetical protein [Burkholderia ubonensis]OMG71398.1 hypothetical protein BW685_21390 [Burkholderia ubonensis]
MSDYNREQFDAFFLGMFGAVTAPLDSEAIERQERADSKRRDDQAVMLRLLDGELSEGAKKERQADAAKRTQKKKFEARLLEQNIERNRALAQRDRDLSL